MHLQECRGVGERERAGLGRLAEAAVALPHWGLLSGAHVDKLAIDIFLKLHGRTTIVQCKRHSGPVGVAVAREIFGVLQSSDADEAILASTGGFTKGVVKFVEGKPIKLLGMSEIIQLHRTASASG